MPKLTDFAKPKPPFKKAAFSFRKKRKIIDKTKKPAVPMPDEEKPFGE